MGGTPSGSRKDDDIDTFRMRATGDEDDSDSDNLPNPLMEPYYSAKHVPDLERVVFKITDDTSGAEKDQNYGIIPLNVVHEVMLFLYPPDLLRMSLTCHLFHSAQNTRFFWKSYYFNMYEKEASEKESNRKLNWKKLFFKRFYLSGDEFYRKKYHVIGKTVFNEETRKSEIVGENPRDKLHPFKIVCLGYTNTGKTSFLDRVLEDKFDEDVEKTIGARFLICNMEYETTEFGDKSYIRLEIWDTGGQEKYRSLIPMYYRFAKGAIIFFQVDDFQTFERAKKWVEEIREEGKKHNHEMAIVLVGSKSDLRNSDREVDFRKHVEPYLLKNSNFGRKKCRDMEDGKDISYVECSAKENKNTFKVIGLLCDSLIQKGSARHLTR